jgi:D-tyrosyl-tRNA(Tyr) deacylase
MKAVVQRVLAASVTVNGVLKGRIGFGLLVYLGVARDDTESSADWLAEKIINLRIFDDAEANMNCSLRDIVNRQTGTVNQGNVNHILPHVNKEDAVNCSFSHVNNILDTQKWPLGVLAVSQFTLLGDARKGRRPSWGKAAPPDLAKSLYVYFMAKIREQGIVCESGEFQAHMRVSYTNDGPVTILLDTNDK